MIITMMIPHTQFGLNCTTPLLAEKNLFLKNSKILNSPNSYNSVWKTKFLPRQAIAKILFLLPSTYTGDTSYQELFNLDKFLNQSKIARFKIRYSRTSKFWPEMRKKYLHFFLVKLQQKLPLTYTGDTLFRVCFNLNNFLTQ